VQYAVAKSAVDSIAEGVALRDWPNNTYFVHLAAKGRDRIFEYDYEATKLAIKRAMSEEPKIDEILEKKASAVYSLYKT
jgi:5,6,7,8-tetrahydromethanopterin hydro-lyase